jgi:HTH-type transcriptional regulator / antitoxin HigA
MPPETEDFRTPGQLLRRLLSERGWSQGVLAVVLGVKQPVVSGLMLDKRRIDPVMAIALGEVFGHPAEKFMDIQKAYDLALARVAVRPDPARASRAKLFADLPITEMIRRGWLNVEDFRDVRAVESELAKFFGVATASEIEILPHAAKKTNTEGEVSPSQLVWLYRVRQLAQQMIVPKYSTSAMTEAIRQMSSLLASPDEARNAPRILNEAGVRFVVVESLPSAKIDGVCFWLDDRSPVIGMSMRFDRIDNFWFVLRHECEHVLRGHGRSTIAFDADLERERAGIGEDIAEQERFANEAAANFCVPAKTLQQFIARKAPIFTERDIRAFAKMLRVHPGILAGQLQRATTRYERFREHLTKVRDIVLPNVMHDGWGNRFPVEHFT